MSGYAIKNGSTEYRQVADASWCSEDETFSTTPPELPPVLGPDVEKLRRVAYADPVNGSDRYLMEAASLVAGGAAWDSAEVRALQVRALQVKSEIQKTYPYK